MVIRLNSNYPEVILWAKNFSVMLSLRLLYIESIYRFHCTTAFAAAIASITKVAVRYDIKANMTKMAEPRAHLKVR